MKKIIFFIVAIIFQLLIIELTLGLFFHFHRDYDAEMWKYSRDIKINVDDARSHIHRESASSYLMGVDLKTNSFGFRNHEISKNSSKDVYRVIAIGDSFTLGWGVEEASAYPQKLESLLKQKCNNIEVINAGIGNYNLEQIGKYVEKNLLSLNPSALIYGFYWNDAEPTQKEPSSWIVKNSYLALFLRKVQMRLFYYRTTENNFLNYYSKTFQDDSWIRFSEAASHLIRLTKEHNIPLYVLLLPELRTRGEKKVTDVYAKVEKLFRVNNVPVTNLQDQLPGELAAYWVDSTDPHPNAKAQKIFSESAVGFWKNCP
ncbi:MAG: GDSL-type esterase/lipase family protein [Oligoflexia bacterium]|nr:GDSL-type esterase/lipase family protein [Oligoflexia bacterium]